MPDIYEITKLLKQAAADAQDHPYGRKETGVLAREKGHLVNDSRVVDGFSIKVGGNIVTIIYEVECKLKDTHANNFETDIETTINDLASYLKKEYKGAIGETLTLTPDGEMDVFMQEVSRVRVLVKASKSYKIGGIDDAHDARKDRKEKFDSLDIMLESNWSPEIAWKKYIEQE